MTPTVKFSEMNAKNVEHFKITTTSAHSVTYARTEEELVNKEKLLTHPHADSHTHRHTRIMTNNHMTVCMDAHPYSSDTSN